MQNLYNSECINCHLTSLLILFTSGLGTKRSLQHLERLLKRKSSEIFNLQQQLTNNSKIEQRHQKEVGSVDQLGLIS